MCTGKSGHRILLTRGSGHAKEEVYGRVQARSITFDDYRWINSSCATLMLENGADIRMIQELLGHASLSTTQIYTEVSIQKLKEVHGLTHPAEKGRGVVGKG